MSPVTREPSADPADYLIVAGKYHALPTLFVDDNIAPAGTEVVDFARPDDVRGKTVCGNVPLFVAACADAVIIANVRIPKERRTEVDMPFDEFRDYVKGYETFQVRSVHRVDV